MVYGLHGADLNRIQIQMVELNGGGFIGVTLILISMTVLLNFVELYEVSMKGTELRGAESGEVKVHGVMSNED